MKEQQFFEAVRTDTLKEIEWAARGLPAYSCYKALRLKRVKRGCHVRKLLQRLENERMDKQVAEVRGKRIWLSGAGQIYVMLRAWGIKKRTNGRSDRRLVQVISAFERKHGIKFCLNKREKVSFHEVVLK